MIFIILLFVSSFVSWSLLLMYTMFSLPSLLPSRTFCELFPDLVEQHERQKRENELNGVRSDGGSGSLSGAAGSASAGATSATAYLTRWSAMAGILFALLACTWAIVALSLQ